MGMQSTIIIASNSISEIESDNFHKEIKDVVSSKIDGLSWSPSDVIDATIKETVAAVALKVNHLSEFRMTALIYI